jgi:hypothetical protein
VADAQPPPVAIRITRPYDSEDEYLANELEMTSKTSITLVGAQPRPQGVVLRFELALTGGQVLVRGEGRVVAFKPNVHRGVGGLTLRFTRIDARSKSFLDKATALREQRRPSSKPPTVLAESASPEPEPLAAPSPPEPVTPAAQPESEPKLPPKPALEHTVMLSAADFAPAPAPAPKPALEHTVMLSAADFAPTTAPKPALEHTVMVSAADFVLPPTPAPAHAPAPANRDALLERLRTRAKALDPAVVQRILER